MTQIFSKTPLFKRTLAQMNVRINISKMLIARNEMNKDEIEGIVAQIVESSKRVKSKFL